MAIYYTPSSTDGDRDIHPVHQMKQDVFDFLYDCPTSPKLVESDKQFQERVLSQFIENLVQIYPPETLKFSLNKESGVGRLHYLPPAVPLIDNLHIPSMIAKIADRIHGTRAQKLNEVSHDFNQSLQVLVDHVSDQIKQEAGQHFNNNPLVYLRHSERKDHEEAYTLEFVGHTNVLQGFSTWATSPADAMQKLFASDVYQNEADPTSYAEIQVQKAHYVLEPMTPETVKQCFHNAIKQVYIHPEKVDEKFVQDFISQYLPPNMMNEMLEKPRTWSRDYSNTIELWSNSRDEHHVLLKSERQNDATFLLSRPSHDELSVFEAMQISEQGVTSWMKQNDIDEPATDIIIKHNNAFKRLQDEINRNGQVGFLMALLTQGNGTQTDNERNDLHLPIGIQHIADLGRIQNQFEGNPAFKQNWSIVMDTLHMLSQKPDPRNYEMYYQTTMSPLKILTINTLSQHGIGRERHIRHEALNNASISLKQANLVVLNGKNGDVLPSQTLNDVAIPLVNTTADIINKQSVGFNNINQLKDDTLSILLEQTVTSKSNKPTIIAPEPTSPTPKLENFVQADLDDILQNNQKHYQNELDFYASPAAKLFMN